MSDERSLLAVRKWIRRVPEWPCPSDAVFSQAIRILMDEWRQFRADGYDALASAMLDEIEATTEAMRDV